MSSSEMKEILRGEYLRRVKAIARSRLYAKNLITAINVWAISVIRYSAGIIDWREKELKDLDIKTRKILTMHGIFHKKSNVDSLYLRRNEGGRGLTSVEDCVKREICNLKDYFDICPEFLVIAANDILFSVDKKDILCESSASETETLSSGDDESIEDLNVGERMLGGNSTEKKIETGKEYRERILVERDASIRGYRGK